MLCFFFSFLCSKCIGNKKKEGVQGLQAFAFCVITVNDEFIYLFIYLFKVDKFTRIQHTYIHKNTQTNWLIKVIYSILQTKN